MMYIKYVATGRLITITEKYIITTEGIFNRKWYRLPVEVEKQWEKQ